MDYVRVIDGLLAQYDLSRDVQRKKAYQACETYAKEHIQGRVEYNSFMEAAASRLNMVPSRRNSLVDELGDVPESARLHLTFNRQTGPELTGNVEGLRYLAAVLAELARHGIEHDHTHLYTDRAPLYGGGYPLTIYHEPDSWFERLDDKQSETNREPGVMPRELQPFEIAALCLLDEVPPDMLLTKGRPYRVLSVDSYEGQEVWEKCIRESKERFYLFTILNDDGAREAFGFDLDDPEVLFFTKEDMASLCDHS